MTTTELATKQSFEDRMKQRIKESFGDLLTEEELTQLVVRGIDEIFFKEREIKVGSGYHSRTEVQQPLIAELLKEQLMPIMKKVAEQYVRDNEDEIKEQVETYFANQAGQAFIKSFDSIFSKHMSDLQYNIQTQMDQIRNKVGY